MSDLQAIKTWPDRSALSPGFIHWCIGGADCRTALRADVALSGLEAQGVPAAAAADHPFDPAACPAASAHGKARLAGPFVRVWGADQARQALQRAPLVGVMDAYADFWEWYGGDVYSPSGVDRSRTHAVAVVGFGEDHWIVKNSLGTAWGVNGYAKVRMETCRLLSDGGLPGYVFDIVQV